MFYIPDDAHDLALRVLIGQRFIAQQQLLADRIFVREITARERLVNHHGPWRGVVLMLYPDSGLF